MCDARGVVVQYAAFAFVKHSAATIAAVTRRTRRMRGGSIGPISPHNRLLRRTKTGAARVCGFGRVFGCCVLGRFDGYAFFDCRGYEGCLL